MDSDVLKEDDYYKDLEQAGIRFIGKFFNVILPSKFAPDDGFIDINDLNDIENKMDFDVLVIHQGVLDKLELRELHMLGSDTSNILKTQREKLISRIKDCVPYVYVTSGRGKPDKIPNGVKFLPFSVIESTLLRKPHSKMILTKQLLGGINA